MSIEELAAHADVIVHGTVTAKSCHRDPAGRIYTRVELRVAEIWKGRGIGERFTIVHGGGRIGNVRSQASLQVEYEPGEEVVAFLRLNKRGEGVTLSLVQGKFNVWRDKATGESFACNLFHGTPAPHREATKLQGAVPEKLALNSLKQRSHGGRK